MAILLCEMTNLGHVSLLCRKRLLLARFRPLLQLPDQCRSWRRLPSRPESQARTTARRFVVL